MKQELLAYAGLEPGTFGLHNHKWGTGSDDNKVRIQHFIPKLNNAC